jgi:hypothetical protein
VCAGQVWCSGIPPPHHHTEQAGTHMVVGGGAASGHRTAHHRAWVWVQWGREWEAVRRSVVLTVRSVHHRSTQCGREQWCCVVASLRFTLFNDERRWLQPSGQVGRVRVVVRRQQRCV